MLSYDCRTNANNIESLFIAVQHSSDEWCVTTFSENSLAHGNNTPAVFTVDQLAERETSNVLFPNYSALYSIGIEKNLMKSKQQDAKGALASFQMF